MSDGDARANGRAGPTLNAQNARRPRTAVVIGAGPYGLAVTAHLAARNVEVRCFGQPLEGWTKHMPAGMLLKSTLPATSIGAPRSGYSLGDYCDEVGLERFDKDGGEVPIPLSVFIAYGLWFQERLVPEVESARVVRVTNSGAGYQVLLDSGERLEAGAVVVATGLMPFAYLPGELRRLRSGPSDDGRVSHSSDHNDLSGFRGTRVAVIGAGQSALEGAVLLREAGAEVDLVVRGPALVWNAPPLGKPPTLLYNMRRPPGLLGASWTLFVLSRFVGEFRYLPDSLRLRITRNVLGPAGAWWLRDRFRDANIAVHFGATLQGARDEGNEVLLDLTDGDGKSDRLVVDHVISATGYRVDLAKLDFLDPLLIAGVETISGSPRLSSTGESSVPGLYFLGQTAATTFGPIMRFVAGSTFAARRATDGIVSRIGRSSPR